MNGMKKFLRFFCGVFAVTLLLCVLYGMNINSAVNETGIEGGAVHFKTPGFMLPFLNGKPDEVREYCETGTKEYIYHDQKLFGQKGSVSYSCLSGVYEVKAAIPVTEQDGEEVFHYVSEYMRNVYSRKEGFYEEEIVKDTEKETISRKFGADFGATGITVSLKLTKNEVHVTVNYQY